MSIFGPSSENRVQGALGFYLASLLSLLVSVDTSWRFFRDDLHITDPRERVVMFAVLEVGLLACGYGMRANVIRHGRPGAPRVFAWLLCGVSGYMAWQLSGLGEGIARVTLGPVLGLVMLHLALGIEIKSRTHHATTWTRIGGELRERLLSRLGLADDARDALTRTQDRAADRAARLALTPWTPFRRARLRKALRTSNVALDTGRRDQMLLALAALRHADGLVDLEQVSPWIGTTPVPPVPSSTETESLPDSRHPQDQSTPSTTMKTGGTGTHLQPSTGGDRSSTSVVPVPPRKTGPRTTAGTKSDAELIEAIRQLQADGTHLTKRAAMEQFRIGTAKASRLLTAARNGQSHG